MSMWLFHSNIVPWTVERGRGEKKESAVAPSGAMIFGFTIVISERRRGEHDEISAGVGGRLAPVGVVGRHLTRFVM